ncbi:MAG TPA: 23S rRNA (guanosine(2251)-2'-O)-methyltransferase RlmB [Rickettsiales bacterium]|nr:23S rRNA (guanosine(2251)-2'-O)-methyltransferase RlmB [Rickettsiales bacterium]
MQQRKSKPEHHDAKTRAYWLYGLHAVRAALANGRREIKRLAATKPAAEKLVQECRKRGITPQIVTPQELSKLLPADAVHQGVAMEVKPLPELSLEMYLAGLKEHKPLLLLDQVTDPHNVGAILRTAAAFGAGAVIVTRDHAPQESAVMAKASSGGMEIVPLIAVTNLAQAIELIKKHGFWCAGLEGEAKQTLDEAKLDHKTALVLGAEGSGMRRLTAERCDVRVRLPIASAMESLNVSNAAAVALYAITRKA